MRGLDGQLGTVRELLFDEATWSIVCVVVDAGGWLLARPVPVAPASLRLADDGSGQLVSGLRRHELERGPVGHRSRIEAHLRRRGPWAVLPEHGIAVPPEGGPVPDDALHSTHTVTGYRALTADGGRGGSVSDVTVELDEWTTSALVVDTGGWWSRRPVLVPPAAVERLDRVDAVVHLNLTQEQLQASPVNDPSALRRQRNPRFGHTGPTTRSGETEE